MSSALPPVKKQIFSVANILSQKNRHICGLCRSVHDSDISAARCLRGCAKSKLQSSILVSRAGPYSENFRPACPYCRRSYDNRASAAECLSGCRRDFCRRVNGVLRQFDIGELNGSVNITGAIQQPKPTWSRPIWSRDTQGASTPPPEASSDDIEFSEATPTPTQAPASALPPPAKEIKNNELPMSGEDFGFEESTLSSWNDLSAPAAKGPVFAPSALDPDTDDLAKARAARAKKKEGEAKWIRVGAKYRCNACSGTHFTRGEVEACYDKHD